MKASADGIRARDRSVSGRGGFQRVGTRPSGPTMPSPTLTSATTSTASGIFVPTDRSATYG
ncbi:hypothetical protein ACQP2P_44100 [Dactylosporangium sp. CA-139114]|uniref:hypothetical protein n=1 Tax=Dactylosporangium sp. CA-139114 TaxID=3239931 RepID=UPI003D98E803